MNIIFAHTNGKFGISWRIFLVRLVSTLYLLFNRIDMGRQASGSTLFFSSFLPCLFFCLFLDKGDEGNGPMGYAIPSKCLLNLCTVRFFCVIPDMSNEAKGGTGYPSCSCRPMGFLFWGGAQKLGCTAMESGKGAVKSTLVLHTRLSPSQESCLCNTQR